jgi:hypothetical protein
VGLLKTEEVREARREAMVIHPGVELRANPKSTSQRCHFFEVVFV